MPRTRTRVDDEEALIPRSDLEEFHMRTKKKMKGRCSRCCSIKCWFGLLFLMILLSTGVFYFIYPSVVHENLNKFIGYACSGYSTTPNVTVSCLVMTSANGLTSTVVAVNNTWARQCTHTYFFYEGVAGQQPIKLQNTFPVDNITSLQAISIALKTNITAWYLHATDDVYISHRKLQRRLLLFKSSDPIYVGDKIHYDSTGAFALSHRAVSLLMNKTKTSENLLSAITSTLNVTTVDESRLNEENPLQIVPDSQLRNMSNAFAFQHVSPGQMYSFYVFDSD